MRYKFGHKTCEILFEHLKPDFWVENSFFIIDRKVSELYPDFFQKAKKVLVDSSEEKKNLQQLERILNEMHRQNVNRKTIIIGVGGGITTDLAGFAAAVFKRGCRLWLVPTTLLGMVDAAIGGKTGLNFKGIKNGIGCFYPAERILIDTDFLKSLRAEEMRAGMVEIIKMSFLATSDLKKFLTENNEQQLIREAVRTKMEICEKDLEDQGRRRLLNLGHTFGHILESVSNYEINHAEAVAIGIRAAAAFSRDLKLISQQKFSRINAFLDQFDLPVYFSGKYRDPIETKGVEILHQDKKADSKINLILFQEDQGLTIYRTDDRHALIKTLLRFAREA